MTRTLRSVLVIALAALSTAGCSSSPSTPPAPPADPYLYRPPPTTPPPTSLDPVIWTAHHHDDLLPFWTTNEALGSPVGNFPTWRQMDGVPVSAKPNRKKGG